MPGQDRLHPRCRNLHRSGKGPPLSLHEFTGSVVGCLMENLQVTTRTSCCSWIFLQLCCTLPPSEEQTGSSSSRHCHAKHYCKELGKRLTEPGRYELRCWGDLCSITWKDRKPIHFKYNKYLKNHPATA